MCGRFTLTTAPEEVASEFELAEPPALEPRFNVAPGQEIAAVGRARDGARSLARLRWGLVPHWAKDPRIGSRLINARSETAASKPAFRDAFRARRCLVPADGFYEWAETGDGPRQPYHIARPDRRCFAIAALFERWRPPEGDALHTCTLLTTDANRRLAPIHARMPVILPRAHWTEWLDPEPRDPEALTALLRPRPDDELAAVPVTRRVNRVELDDAECLAPLPVGAG